jgi:hypothetical protein
MLRGFPICSSLPHPFSATWGYLITNVSSVKEERNRRFLVRQSTQSLDSFECDSLRYPEWELADFGQRPANKANHR